MGSAQYMLAATIVVCYPPIVLFWFFVHPFASHWQQHGPRRSYATLLPILVTIGTALFFARDRILSIHFGLNGIFVGLAMLSFAGALVIDLRCRQQLPLATLIGVPEISCDGRPSVLLTRGIYAEIRHPRYVASMLGLTAVAFFTNYLATYVIAVTFLPVIYVVVIMEERELIRRFGADYDAYRQTVPRFFPRLK